MANSRISRLTSKYPVSFVIYRISEVIKTLKLIPNQIWSYREVARSNKLLINPITWHQKLYDLMNLIICSFAENFNLLLLRMHRIISLFPRKRVFNECFKTHKLWWCFLYLNFILANFHYRTRMIIPKKFSLRAIMKVLIKLCRLLLITLAEDETFKW